MTIGSMKEASLTSAKDVFLLNCQFACLDAQTLTAYRDVLGLFIEFTGDMLLRELTPDHVRTYISILDDYPDKGKEHIRLVMDHYVVIHTWIRWMYAQKFVTERYSSTVKPPRLTRRLDLLSDLTHPSALAGSVTLRFPSEIRRSQAASERNCVR